MNIFKNIINVALGLALIILYSCQKDESNSKYNSLSNEINKVETIYKDGDIKLEFTGNTDFQKIETSASETYKAKIQRDLEQSVSKQTTYLKSGGGNVGILKNGSCGSYQE